MATPTPAHDLTSLESDPRLFLYTSLTAGSSHIITATSRLETILKANRIPFQAIDIATDEKARRLWQRRAGTKKIPGLVKEGFVLGDLEEIEEWNEFGELKENIGPVPPANAPPPVGGQTGVNIAPPLPVIPTATAGTANVGPSSAVNKAAQPLLDSSKRLALPGAAEIAARNDKSSSSKAQDPGSAAPSTSVIDEPIKAETMTSAPAEKEQSLKQVKEIAGDHPSIQHLSAPASAIQSGTATPAPVVGGEGEEREDGKVEEGGEGGSAAVEDEKKEGEGESAVVPEKVDEAAGETSLPKAAGDEEDKKENHDTTTTDVTKGVQGLQVGDEGAKTQEQEAKDADEATKSVED